jgi:hypothetical protein
VGDVLDNAAAYLERVRGSSMARSVTYRRGANTAALTVTVGDALTETTEAGTVLSNATTRDYLAGVSDFATMAAGWGDGRAYPLAGDRITDGATTWVVGGGDGGDVYAYLSGHRHTLRVHCVEVAT